MVESISGNKRVAEDGHSLEPLQPSPSATIVATISLHPFKLFSIRTYVKRMGLGKKKYG